MIKKVHVVEPHFPSRDDAGHSHWILNTCKYPKPRNVCCPSHRPIYLPHASHSACLLHRLSTCVNAVLFRMQYKSEVFQCFNLRSWNGVYTSSMKSLFVVYMNSLSYFRCSVSWWQGPLYTLRHEFDKHCWMSVHPSSPVVTQPCSLVKGKRREARK
jgi:hypothetical protein